MAQPAERMKAMRVRRRQDGLREIRVTGPDLRDPAVQARVAAQFKALDQDEEAASLAWIEDVSIFDETR